eukprot:symbB.v1.2.033498.t1/scaffold4167.1/size45294/1
MAPLASVQGQVKRLFTQALNTAFPGISHQAKVVKGNPKYGDYQCNDAIMIFKEHGSGQVAETIRDAIPANEILGEIFVAAQGFISVKVSEAWLSTEVSKLLEGEVEYVDLPRKRARIQVRRR